MRKNRWTSSDWVNPALRGCLLSNYSFLDVLLGRWRYKPSKYEYERQSYLNLRQRHQIRSRFL